MAKNESYASVLYILVYLAYFFCKLQNDLNQPNILGHISPKCWWIWLHYRSFCSLQKGHTGLVSQKLSSQSPGSLAVLTSLGSARAHTSHEWVRGLCCHVSLYSNQFMLLKFSEINTICTIAINGMPLVRDVLFSLRSSGYHLGCTVAALSAQQPVEHVKNIAKHRKWGDAPHGTTLCSLHCDCTYSRYRLVRYRIRREIGYNAMLSVCMCVCVSVENL